MENEVFEICCERGADPEDQQRRIVAAIAGGIDIHYADKNGVTALHHAVRFRSRAAVETLLKHGADANCACRRNGSTPLYRAVTQSGAPGTAGKAEEAREIVRVLLDAGADLSLANKVRKLPIDYVIDEEMARLLRASDDS